MKTNRMEYYKNIQPMTFNIYIYDMFRGSSQKEYRHLVLLIRVHFQYSLMDNVYLRQLLKWQISLIKAFFKINYTFQLLSIS